VVKLLILQVTQGSILLVIIFFSTLALLLLGLLSKGILSLWSLRHHNLYLKMFLVMRYELG
jgi:hypothetical protein